jgi:hypothetical protein
MKGVGAHGALAAERSHEAIEQQTARVVAQRL